MSTPPMSQSRRKRHIRQTNPPNMRLMERDIEIVEAVYRFRVLKQSQIAALFFGSREAAQYRLERLYDHKYLERVFVPVALGEGRSPTFYVLDKAGAELLRLERGYDEIKWFDTSRELTREKIAHTTAINDFMVSMAVACNREGFELTWQTENEVKAQYDRVSVKTSSGKSVDLPILPDSILTIATHDRLHRCLLELDRGTMEADRFKNKVRAYVEYYQSGKYEARYHSKTMRVLTIIATKYSGEKRLMNLKRATEQVGGKRRFWFTTAKEISPESVLYQPIWLLATEDELRSLIEPGGETD